MCFDIFNSETSLKCHLSKERVNHVVVKKQPDKEILNAMWIFNAEFAKKTFKFKTSAKRHEITVYSENRPHKCSSMSQNI